MVNLQLPRFNYSTHRFLVLFEVKPWLIFVRETTSPYNCVSIISPNEAVTPSYEAYRLS